MNFSAGEQLASARYKVRVTIGLGRKFTHPGYGMRETVMQYGFERRVALQYPNGIAARPPDLYSQTR
jgi:hypothetical protein